MAGPKKSCISTEGLHLRYRNTRTGDIIVATVPVPQWRADISALITQQTGPILYVHLAAYWLLGNPFSGD
jgi:hypothetical protein